MLINEERRALIKRQAGDYGTNFRPCFRIKVHCNFSLVYALIQNMYNSCDQEPASSPTVFNT